MAVNKWFKKNDAAHNMTTTVAALFHILKVPATVKHIKETLVGHPDFPTLLSLADTLPRWGVRTEGVKGEVDDLSPEDYPSLVYLNSGDFAVLEDIKDGTVKLTDPRIGKIEQPLKEFGASWTGILLRTDPQEGAAEKDYQKNRKQELFEKFRSFLVLAGLPLAFIIYFIYGLFLAGETATLAPLAVAKTLGFIVCAVMAAGSLGGEELLNNLCPTGKVVNCQRVVNSPAGRLLGMPMSELGLVYFGGGLLALLEAMLTGQTTTMLLLLGVLNLMTLPYTVFSVIYQGAVIRSWCWMCLVVQALFWIEFYFLYGIVFKGAAPFNPAALILFVFAFAVVSLVWLALRFLFIRSAKTAHLEAQIKRARRNPVYVQSQLAKAQKLDIGSFPFEVEVGPEKAGLVATLVVNPLCGHCKQALNYLHQLIEMGQGSIKGVIRFMVRVDDTDSTKTETEKLMDYHVALQLAAMAALGKRQVTSEAISQWFSGDAFSKGRYKKWLRHFEVDDQNALEKAGELLKLQREWAVASKIGGTPTVIINGAVLPKEMQLNDLEIFLLRQIQK